MAWIGNVQDFYRILVTAIYPDNQLVIPEGADKVYLVADGLKAKQCGATYRSR